MTEEEMEDFLAHFGVLGMRWGVRRSDVKQTSDPIPDTKTAKGDVLKFEADKTPLLANLASHLSSRLRDKINRGDGYSLKNAEGKSIGELSLETRGRELNVIWVGVDPKHEGKGYGTAAMKSAISLAKKRKLDRVTLEVPGTSPNAKHIYEKLGFKDYDNGTPPDPSDVWGGLYPMKLELNNIKHDSTEAVEDFLEHFGVKGMRWGVRKAKENFGVTADSKAVKKLHGRTKKGGTDTLTNEELEKAIKRMDLEQKYRKVKGNDSWKKKGLQLAGQILKEFGMAYISSFVKHPTANAASGGTYAWAYAGAKTIDSVVVNRRELEN